MKYKLNAYFATLIVTIAGSVATLIIVHTAFATTFNIVLVTGESKYPNYFSNSL